VVTVSRITKGNLTHRVTFPAPEIPLSPVAALLASSLSTKLRSLVLDPSEVLNYIFNHYFTQVSTRDFSLKLVIHTNRNKSYRIVSLQW
jgi:hypothetical protein